MLMQALAATACIAVVIVGSCAAMGITETTSTPPAAAHGVRRWARPRSTATELQLVFGLALVVAIFAVSYPDTFATTSNLENMARVGAILLVVAIGQSCALVVGGFDISVAANMGFVSTIAALGMTQYGGLGTGIALGLLAGAGVGLINGVLIAGFGVSPFVVGLGMLTFRGG